MKIRRKTPIEKVNFSARNHSRKGINSFIIGILSWCLYIGLSILLGKNIIRQGIYIGVFGLLILAISILGFYLAYQSTKEKDIFYRFPILGLVTNGILILFLITIYMMGIMI